MTIKCIFIVDYTASAKCRYQSHHSMGSQAPKKEHLMKSGIIKIQNRYIRLLSAEDSFNFPVSQKHVFN
jgi:hypothetical protein